MAGQRLTVGQFLSGDFVRTVFCASPGAGTTREDTLDPAFWANVCYQLQPGSRIEVIPEDQSFFQELLVRDVGNGRARVHELRYVDLDKAPVQGESAAAPDLVAEHLGMHRKWCVVRPSDRTVVAEKLANRAAAEEWIATNRQRAA